MRKQERDRNKARRDALVARIAELEAGIKKVLIPDCDYQYSNTDACIMSDILAELLNRQPRQSLDLLRAEVLEEMARKVGAGIDKKYSRIEEGNYVCTSTSISYYITESGLMGEAAELRNKAEVKDD